MTRIQKSVKKQEDRCLIRKVSKSDYSKVLELIQCSNEKGVSVDKSRKFLRSCLQNGFCFVIEKNGIVEGIGCAQLDPYDDEYEILIKITNDNKELEKYLLHHLIEVIDNRKDAIVRVQKTHNQTYDLFYKNGFRVYQEYPTAYYMKAFLRRLAN